MDHLAHRHALTREGAAVAALPADGLGAAVTACPGWDVERLIGHLGRVHAWAASFLNLGPDGGTPDAGGRPPAGPDIFGWYAERLHGLLEELDRHDPSEPSRSFTGPAPVAFWHRRQAHETAVHRWDAQAAIGEPDPIETALAADGVDEWLEVFVPRPAAKGAVVPAHLVGAELALHCTDAPAGAPHHWLLRLEADGPRVSRGLRDADPAVPADGPQAAIGGPAGELLLTVWHRRPLDAGSLTVSDAAAATAIIDTVHI